MSPKHSILKNQMYIYIYTYFEEPNVYIYIYIYTFTLYVWKVWDTKIIDAKILRQIITYINYINNLFEEEEEVDYYKPIIVGGFHSNNYIEYESNGDRNKT